MNPEQMAKQGEDLYSANKQALEDSHMGQYVAFHIETGEYFVAPTPEEASKKAKEKFPSSISYLTRIGPDRGVFTIRSQRGKSDFWPINFGTVPNR